MSENKLIRDLIPEIIKARGARPLTHIAGQQEYATRLKAKLQEEVDEFLKDKNAEELADILEVIYALCDQIGISRDKLEKLRAKKAAERGGFKNRIVLDGVEEKQQP